MRLKIATWNINSLRVRLPQVLVWLQQEKPDIFVLQETKVPDELFPCEALQAAGYHIYYNGQKTYNGVAILSKQPLRDLVTELPQTNPAEKRVLGASLGKLRIWNVYVPNGESILSEKYTYKLAWLDQLKNLLRTELQTHSQLVLLGDFNVAPAALDVHDAARWEGQVLFSEPERARLQALFALGLEDCFRRQQPGDQSYSWWDYRLNAFKRNLGLRIDLILASTALAANCLCCRIDKAARGVERPSDHAPVLAEFEVDL